MPAKTNNKLTRAGLLAAELASKAFPLLLRQRNDGERDRSIISCQVADVLDNNALGNGINSHPVIVRVSTTDLRRRGRANIGACPAAPAAIEC